MTRSLPTMIIGLLLFAIFVWFCMRHHIPLIESDIENRASQALISEQIEGVSVAGVSGLDVTLGGVAASDEVRDKAIATITGLDGVHQVLDEITVNPASSSVQSGSGNDHFSADFDGQTVTLTGGIADSSSRASVVGAARQAFAGQKVIDHLTVSSSIPANWTPIIKSSLQQLRELETGKLDIRESRILLVGSAVRSGVKNQISSNLQQISGASFTSRLDISVLAPTTQVIEDCQDELGQVLQKSAIKFDTGSNVISVDSYPLLDALADVISSCAGVSIEVQGHTDSAGDENANLRLSERRAASVISYLNDEGIDTSRLQGRGYGESQPVADNATAAGRSQNRRIEFVTLGN